MKALVYTKANEVVYRDEPDPVPGAGQVLVNVAASGGYHIAYRASRIIADPIERLR